MSIMNPLPPQAYTKETLVQAYAWLQNQSQGIKELATTPDVLVSLFLKARLQGDGALERPSIQNFKNELKNLAGMMGEFEVLESNTTHGTTASSTIRFRSQDFRERAERTNSAEKPAPEPVSQAQAHSQLQSRTHHSQLHEQRRAYQQVLTPQTFEPPPPPAPPAPVAPPPVAQPEARAATLDGTFDTRSLDMIQEVKIQFNLSSDTEAIRLLLAVGYNQVKSLLNKQN